MIRYRSCRPPDTELRVQLRELANARRRFGYRRLFVLLRQHPVDFSQSYTCSSAVFIDKFATAACCMLHGLSTLDVSVARQREPRGPAADVHPMTSETTPTERHPDVADVLPFASFIVVTQDTNSLRAVLSCALSLDAPDVFCIKILPCHFQVVVGL
jgi:hypothetical protein